MKSITQFIPGYTGVFCVGLEAFDRYGRTEEHVLSDFYDKLLYDNKPCPPEFNRVVDEHFWELF